VARVLVVDDDRSLLRALRLGLSALGHELVTASTGHQGISQAALTQPDVVVLDLGLPDADGLEVCRSIRQWSDVPVLVLSATDAEGRKVAALDVGADDYVTKPFGMAELDARIRAMLRRRSSPVSDVQSVTVGDLEIDLVHHEARTGGHRIELTSREFDVLAFLARNSGRTCTRQMILDAVWGPGYRSDAAHLRVYVHRLRQKLGADGAMLKSVPGIGYSLEPA
jgi:two-component system, OmpR family, KDP operon response regulator KdpE